MVDPEYLGNMEFPRTSLSARAGLLTGYGLGLYHHLRLPYPTLGHEGGIDGFLSVFGYSPSRDVGFVVLINGTWDERALERLASLAIRYLKRNVAPPVPPAATISADDMVQVEGYYQPANPRNQVAAFIDYLRLGFRVRAQDGQLLTAPVFGPVDRLVPAGNGLFRREGDIVPSLAFAPDDTGRMVLTGTFTYAERRSALAADLLRWSLALASVLALTVLMALPIWLVLAALQYGDSARVVGAALDAVRRIGVPGDHAAGAVVDATVAVGRPQRLHRAGLCRLGAVPDPRPRRRGPGRDRLASPCAACPRRLCHRGPRRSGRRGRLPGLVGHARLPHVDLVT